MATLTLKGLKKVYDRHVVAVHGMDLEIRDKEFIVFVGPSGCGKSTMLRMIAGLERISEGELYIDGKLVNQLPSKDRDIAMVFQSYALYPHMTVYDNIAFGMKIRHASKEEIDRKVREAASILNITEFLNRKPKALSGGQRQRVAIGRAIVREPKVFLMDEPLSNLDAKLRNQMRAEILKLHQRIDTTFLYVTHDQTEAMTLGDRIVIMKDGFVQQIGTPTQVFDHPANTFVAGFIGAPQMNFLDAELIRQDGGYAVSVAGVCLPLTQEQNSALDAAGTPPQPITLGVRPEHLELCGPEEEGAVLHGTCDVFELMGSSIHIHVDCGGKPIVLVRLTAEPQESRNYYHGTPISFRLLSPLVHLFERSSGRNLLPVQN